MIRVGDHSGNAHLTDKSKTPKNLILTNLNLAIVNISSITNKLAELETFLVNNTVDILIGTESHLDTSVQDSEIIPKDFNTYRKDRNRFGGGVLVLVKNTLSSSTN